MGKPTSLLTELVRVSPNSSGHATEPLRSLNLSLTLNVAHLVLGVSGLDLLTDPVGVGGVHPVDEHRAQGVTHGGTGHVQLVGRLTLSETLGVDAVEFGCDLALLGKRGVRHRCPEGYLSLVEVRGHLPILLL